MEITLEQLLAAREARAAYIRTLQKRFPGACVAVLTVVSPGPVKRSPETIRLFDAGIQAISRVIQRNELIPLVFESHEKDTGDEAYLVVKTEPGFLKMELCKLEEAAPCGRLWDMDVIRPNGLQLSREEIGFPERGCIVCGKAGRACYSRRLHTQDEVQAAYRKLLSTLPE
ncbi:MAG TPA: citrate lyase holo-[acyl-carrier protein] synthase [Clostridia bacterium]|nr:citrate lyase holo-[acyl-carrier protein] synthase [Clostridia bacterium]